ncbi:uncharacterized protein LOC34617439 [Cyclospora cayetanensis]|uniref:Uncharacterized protein LOC34617439 n=1 Tax=Cyclospora cayetanensis TaxID=88456 RepID=A0A6P6RW75_9EIME|nr:uncharacterized protein LOC34617439 [Cyclospora cayetanensis]
MVSVLGIFTFRESAIVFFSWFDWMTPARFACTVNRVLLEKLNPDWAPHCSLLVKMLKILLPSTLEWKQVQLKLLSIWAGVPKCTELQLIAHCTAFAAAVYNRGGALSLPHVNRVWCSSNFDLKNTKMRLTGTSMPGIIVFSGHHGRFLMGKRIFQRSASPDLQHCNFTATVPPDCGNCRSRKLSPLEVELQRQRNALRAVAHFVAGMQKCLKYWDKSGKVLRVGISGYFYDKPTYQRPVEAVVNALKPQLDLMRKANGEAAKSIAKVERANRRKYKAEKLLSRKEAALKKLQKKAQTGKDPQAAHKVKAAEDQVQLAKNGLQMAEAELAREMQQTMNGAAPEAAMQVSRALEAMLLFLMGSGVDIGAVRAAIKTLEEAPYVSPLTAMGSTGDSRGDVSKAAVSKGARGGPQRVSMACQAMGWIMQQEAAALAAPVKRRFEMLGSPA